MFGGATGCATIPVCNIALPLWWWAIPVAALFGFYVIEVLVFWFMARRWYRTDIKFRTIFWAVLVANVVTSIVGTLTMSLYFIMYLHLFILAFVLSVLIEWLVLLQFFRNDIGARELLKISMAMNTVSYVVLAFVLSFMGILFEQ